MTGSAPCPPAPPPLAAYTQWMTACLDAGWTAGPAAEQVPVQAALGRVTAAQVRARWASPRSIRFQDNRAARPAIANAKEAPEGAS